MAKGGSSKSRGSKSSRPTKAEVKKAASILASDNSTPIQKHNASVIMNEAQGNNT
jgi:hypothetical protein